MIRAKEELQTRAERSVLPMEMAQRWILRQIDETYVHGLRAGFSTREKANQIIVLVASSINHVLVLLSVE